MIKELLEYILNKELEAVLKGYCQHTQSQEKATGMDTGQEALLLI